MARSPAAVSVAVSALWIACFILTFGFPILKDTVGMAGTFWLYAAICFAGFVFVWFLVPETKGKSLEQIERDKGIAKEVLIQAVEAAVASAAAAIACSW